ncbi:MAG: hypothetical protein AAGI08_10595 [Bacteroidota bacterium]
MATRSPQLIDALRSTANRLEGGDRYEWGHMGRCNCGHLVQTITNMSSYEIVKAVDFAMDEWTEHAKDYCAGTGSKVDDIFLALHDAGFTHEDVMHLEYLSDKRVLNRIQDRPPLRRNNVDDVTLYMRTLAKVLEDA